MDPNNTQLISRLFFNTYFRNEVLKYITEEQSAALKKLIETHNSLSDARLVLMNKTNVTHLDHLEANMLEKRQLAIWDTIGTNYIHDLRFCHNQLNYGN